MNTPRIEQGILEAQAHINNAIGELEDIAHLVDELSYEAFTELQDLISDLEIVESNVASFDVMDYEPNE